jgi:Spy/CpxP family protein refolding chaperone
MKLLVAAVVLSTIASAASAQSPYAGMQTRSIKSLSDQQVADLKAGRGMSLAMPAELNGYPGPAHVLDLAGQLGLTADQKARVQSLFDSMKAEAVPLGAKLLEQEATLDHLFASHSITADNLKTITAQIGVTQAALRDTHLKYHLQAAQILTPEQMQQYSVLRGYGSGTMIQHHHDMQ